MEEKPKPIDDAGENVPKAEADEWNMTPDEKVEDIEAVDASGPKAKDTAEQIVERVMPDGTIFRGTIEEWKDEIDAWRDRAGVA